MAECCYTRCVQERRNIRRDLQKWTKNMVQVVGLERIAEELMGRRKWKQYQESLSRSILHQPPINNNVDDDKLGERLRDDDALAAVDGEVVRVRDWSPTSEKCALCVDSDGNLEAENHGNGHHAAPSLQSPHASDSDSSAESRSEGEAEVEATSSHPHQNNNTTPHNTSPHLTMSALESVHSMLAAAAVLQPFYQQHHPPAVFPPPHWYLSTLARHLQEAATTTVPPVSPPIQQQQRSAAVAMPPADQPLDLSAKPSGVNNSVTQASFEQMKLQQRTFDPKQIFKAKPRLSGPIGGAGGGPGGAAGRRAYTEDELQAALRDIQSGKLGTRRAAVIYGIPRSTLRNKVYKLAMERERDTLHLPQVVSAPSPSASPSASEVATPTPAPAPAEDDELSAAEEEKEVEKVLQKPLLSMDDILRFSAMEGSGAPDALKGFLQRSLRDKQDLWASLEHSAVGSYIQSLLAASGLKQEDTSDDHHFNNGTSTHRSENNLSRQSSSSSVARDAAACDAGDASDTRASSDSPSSVILKIPSFRPSAATSPPAPKSLMSLRDVIAKSISQKFQQTGTPPPQSSADYDMGGSYKRSRFTPPLPLGSVSVIKSHHQDSVRQYPMSQHHQSQNKPAGSSSSSSGGCTSGGTGTGGKGTRPKRGKYRNYDRDSLVEAVRAVQRGEMSVHRAGSYYGVPHSTLEYKVKERHLMRPRKRDPKPQAVDDKQTKPGMPAVKPGQTPNKPPSYATSPNGLKLPPLFEPVGYTPPPPPAFPFWHHASFPPLGYAPTAPADLFATQMMQRLHERGDESPGPANGSFLDGIIRSSLDKQPEDKNRALLDQLCRDTRPAERKSVHSEEEETTASTPPPPMQQTSRIYVKPQLQEITKPENLKPEALMRLRDHNGQV